MEPPAAPGAGPEGPRTHTGYPRDRDPHPYRAVCDCLLQEAYCTVTSAKQHGLPPPSTRPGRRRVSHTDRGPLGWHLQPPTGPRARGGGWWGRPVPESRVHPCKHMRAGPGGLDDPSTTALCTEPRASRWHHSRLPSGLLGTSVILDGPCGRPPGLLPVRTGESTLALEMQVSAALLERSPPPGLGHTWGRGQLPPATLLPWFSIY